MKLIIEDLKIRGPEDIFKTTKEIVADRIKPESESIKRFREISLSILLDTIRLDRIDKMKLLINPSRKSKEKLEKLLEEHLWNKWSKVNHSRSTKSTKSEKQLKKQIEKDLKSISFYR